MHDGGLGGDTTQPEVREAWYAMTPDRLYEFCRHQTDFMNFVNDTRQIFMFFFEIPLTSRPHGRRITTG